MRLNLVLVSLAGLLTAACSQKSDRLRSGSEASDAARKAMPVPNLPGRGDDAATPSVDSVQELLRGFGMTLARSPEDDRLTGLVTEHMKRAKIPFPPNFRFFISRRGDDWVVTVMDLEAIRKGKRPEGSAYHISDRGGKLTIISGEPGI